MLLLVTGCLTAYCQK